MLVFMTVGAATYFGACAAMGLEVMTQVMPRRVLRRPAAG